VSISYYITETKNNSEVAQPNCKHCKLDCCASSDERKYLDAVPIGV